MEIFVIPLNDERAALSAPLGATSSPAPDGSRSTLPWDQHHFLAGPENASICALATHFLPELLVRREAVEHWNPLVLYGPAGSGKSHLVHGLMARWQEANPADSCCMMDAVDFARELASAIEVNRVSEFRGRFQKLRLFILEDLQHLLRKSSTQLELQTIIDGMIRRGCECIVTSNRSVNQLPWLATTLSSRLMNGVSLNVRRVSQSTRLNLLRDLLAARGLSADGASIEQIAAHAGKSVATLRGTVAELALLSQHTGNTELARLLPSWSRNQPGTAPTFDLIIRTLTEHFHLTSAQLRSASRARTIVLARSLTMLIARDLLQMSYAEIGRCLGGRDHTTVLHGCRKIKAQVDSDPVARDTYQALLQKIKNAPPDQPSTRGRRSRRTA